MTDNTWAWMSGNTSAYPRALFGPKNVSSAEFYPGSRQYSAGFYDSSLQEFWLFGGNGADNTSTLGEWILIHYQLQRGRGLQTLFTQLITKKKKKKNYRKVE